MLRHFITAAAVLASAVYGQTTTDCNPLNVTCPPDQALGISNYTWNVAGTPKIDWQIWNNTGGIEPTVDSGAANLTITKSGNAPTIKTQFYYFFGTATVIMRASPGTGIISAMTSLSDDLDEIDFEFKGGNDSFVSTNFYGKYNKDTNNNGNGTDVKLSFDPRADFHNYTTTWTNTSLQWWVDGKMVRELKSDDPATEGGKKYPQTPMTLKLGSWAGGDSSQPEGTQVWAGGKTDYSKGPFDMSVAHVYVSDASSGKTYTYGDNSGSWQSIKIEPGNSTIASYLASPAEKTFSQSVNDKVASLSSGAKIGIACGVAGFVVFAALLMTVCCIKQRRAGRKEAAVAEAEFQKQEAELMDYRRQQGANGYGQMPGFGYQEFKGKH